jgi:hypothetical protein
MRCSMAITVLQPYELSKLTELFLVTMRFQ